MSLRKKTTDYILGDIFVKCFSFVIVLIMGTLIDPQIIGVFSLVLFVVDFTNIIIVFNMNSSVIRFYRENPESLIFSNAFFQVLFNFILSSCALLVIGYFLKKGIYQFIYYDYILLIILLMVMFSHSLTLAHFISKGESTKVKWLCVASSVINLVMILIFAYTGIFTVEKLIIARIVSLCLFMITFIYLAIRLVKIKNFSLYIFKKNCKYSLPLFLSTLIGTLNLYFSRIILSNYFSPFELGIYSYFLMIITGINVLLVSFNNAWYPHLLDIYTDLGENHLINTINVFYKKAILLGFFFVLFPSLILLLSNYFYFDFKGYYKYRKLIFIMFDSLIITGFYVLIANVVYIKKKTQFVYYNSFYSLIFNVVITFSLIKWLGLYGASLSLVLIGIFSYYTYYYYSIVSLESKLFLSRSNCLYLNLIVILIVCKDIYLYFY